MTTLPTGLTAGTYQIDPSHSQARFTVRHAGISKVRGTVGITSGTITAADTVEGSTVTAELAPGTVATGDGGRDEHLRTSEFFDVENHPTWSFQSTGVAASGADFAITGDLTIKGTTKSVVLDTEYTGSATDLYGNARIGFEAATEISRKEFGLTWSPALEAGGLLVGDSIKITLDLSAIRQS